MPTRINTGFILDQLEEYGKSGHFVGDALTPTWLLFAAKARMEEIAYDARVVASTHRTQELVIDQLREEIRELKKDEHIR